MSETNLNDLSKIYQDQIAEKKKDDTYLEPDMKKRQANNEKARKDLMKGPQMKNPHFEEKQLDPVGQEDGDVNNDGKKDSTDKYLMKRRKAIGKAMKKESFISSDWRNDLSEVINDIESKPIKEKKVNNKIKINPTMGEAVEAMGGTLLEEIEVDEFEGVVEEVYDELIEEGYSEDDVESALEQALIEARVTVGHDTEAPKRERTRDKLKKKAKGFLGKVAVKAYNKAREAKAAAAPAAQRAKTSAKRGIRKMAQKVVDRMSEEVVGEAVYGGTKKPAPTDKRLTVTNADKAGNTPAYQKYKAGDKNYKAADHMKEEQVDEEKKPLPKTKMFRKAGNLGRDAISTPIDPEKRQKAYDRSKKIIKTLNQNEEVEQVDEADSLAGMQAGREKRLTAQRKRESTTASGRDFGHDYSLSDKQQKARRDAEFKAGIGTKKEEVEVDEAMSSYDRNRKRAAQRAAERNAARAAGKTGVVPGVGYVSPRKERETYVDSAGTTRHKSGAKMEEVEQVDELYKGKHGQSEKEYQDSRSDGGKMVSGDSKRSGAAYSSRAVKNTGPNPAGGSKKPQGQGRMTSGARADLQYRKANMRKEEAAMSPGEVALQKKKAMIDKMIASKRMQGLKSAKKSEAPTKAMGEGLSIDQQMKISRDHNRKSPEERKAANMKALSGIKKGTPKKDTRTDAQKMTDATGPRPGSRYRGD